jgi:hypothetical protein
MRICALISCKMLQMSPLKQVVLAYFTAPFLFVSSLKLYASARGNPSHTEWSLDVALYLWSVMYVILPIVATLVAMLAVQSKSVRLYVGAFGIAVLFPIAQVAALISVVDALSTPLPDDPSFLDQLRNSLEGLSIEALLALGSAGAVGILLLVSARRSRPLLSMTASI